MSTRRCDARRVSADEGRRGLDDDGGVVTSHDSTRRRDSGLSDGTRPMTRRTDVLIRRRARVSRLARTDEGRTTRSRTSRERADEPNGARDVFRVEDPDRSIGFEKPSIDARRRETRLERREETRTRANVARSSWRTRSRSPRAPSVEGRRTGELTMGREIGARFQARTRERQPGDAVSRYRRG